MTIYSFILFIHVLSATALFVALALEGVITIRVRTSRDIEESQFFVRAFRPLLLVPGAFMRARPRRLSRTGC